MFDYSALLKQRQNQKPPTLLFGRPILGGGYEGPNSSSINSEINSHEQSTKPWEEALKVCGWNPTKDQEQNHPAGMGLPILGGAFGGSEGLTSFQTLQTKDACPSSLNKSDISTLKHSQLPRPPSIPNVPKVLRSTRTQPSQSNPVTFNQDVSSHLSQTCALFALPSLLQHLK